MGNYERLMELAEQLGADTCNKATYMLTCNQIRDFCRDAIVSGRLPSDAEIDRCVGEHLVYDMDGEEDEFMRAALDSCDAVLTVEEVAR